ncbi:hypothetical protein BU16DRAFT_560640 [Lophium mytilinum]|uniref:F-box domain-containing protein n=1 Tax=Lophium mytilinum TaxID=390894 RepID=A0A6A6QUA9_9PEZI|nr:hypothetical protein BU16DRAFT_560640 [Lophium mytilinum]
MTKITDLPVELQLTIFDAIKDFSDVNVSARRTFFDLSLTCRKYRSLLAPTLFDRITLRNEIDSAASVNALSTSEYGQYTKDLRFEGSLCGKEYDTAMEPFAWNIFNGSSEDIRRAVEAIFPAAVHDMLSNVYQYFPNLENVSVRFREDTFWDYDGVTSRGDLFRELRHSEASGEEWEHWKILMVKTYQALCKNKRPIKRLDLQDLMPCALSTFHTREFKQLLNGLETFKISIFEDLSEIRYVVMGLDGYRDFYSKLGSLFFDHLALVKNVSFEACTKSWEQFGMTTRLFPLCVASSQMPMVKSLRVHGTLIRGELIQFLANHCHTLQHVTLDHCVVQHHFPHGLSRWEHTWGDLFRALAGSNTGNSALRQLHIKNVKSADVEIPQELTPIGKTHGFVYVDSLVFPKYVDFKGLDDEGVLLMFVIEAKAGFVGEELEILS